MTATAVVGLGIIGSAIAQHLRDAGCEVLGYDVDLAGTLERESVVLVFYVFDFGGY